MGRIGKGEAEEVEEWKWQMEQGREVDPMGGRKAGKVGGKKQCVDKGVLGGSCGGVDYRKEGGEGGGREGGREGAVSSRKCQHGFAIDWEAER